MGKRGMSGLLVALLALSMVVLAGCQDDDKAGENLPQTDTVEVELYYVSNQYIESGDESLEILDDYDTVMEASDTLYMDILEALRTVPQGWSKAADRSSMIGENIVFNDARLEKGTLFVDLSSEGLNGGSLEEAMLVQQITKTFFESFDDDVLQRIQFLVDGSEAETLMGHLDVSAPYERTED